MIASKKNIELSVVIPVYQEGDNIKALLLRLIPVMESLALSFEILFVDDGSNDETWLNVLAASNGDKRIRGISFSRNFGKEIAIAAGLDHAFGEAIILIDADLQHPPETIIEFVAKWKEGYDMVYGQRIKRDTDGFMRRWLTTKFYNLFAKVGDTPLPPGGGDFRLMNKRVVEALRRMKERARFTKGLYSWVGFKSIAVPFNMDERLHGSSKMGYFKLFSFAFDGLFSFSTLPLRLATYSGFLISLLAFGYGIKIFIQTILYGTEVPGFPSLMVSIMFFSGLQLIFLGLLGEYTGMIFAEVKHRPLYIVAEEIAQKMDDE